MIGRRAVRTATSEGRSMRTRTIVLTGVVVCVLAASSLHCDAAGPRVRFVARADACTSLCEFPLCFEGKRRPFVTVCQPGQAAMVVLATARVMRPTKGPNGQVSLTIRGSKVVLQCESM